MRCFPDCAGCADSEKDYCPICGEEIFALNDGCDCCESEAESEAEAEAGE